VNEGVACAGAAPHPDGDAAPLLHLGLDPSFIVCDELASHRDGALYEALRSAMVKRSGVARTAPAWGRLHLNARVAAEGSWLPAGAVQRCVGTPIFTPGENIYVGVDVGSTASATAVAYVNEALHVGVEIFHGEEGILRAIDAVHDLAGQYRIVECAGDPWRWGQAGLELRARGINATDFPQTDVRMVPASQALRDALVERRMVLPPDRELAEHAANAVQRQGRRGWRIDKPSREANIDAVIALCIALQRAENRPAPLRVLWCWLGSVRKQV